MSKIKIKNTSNYQLTIILPNVRYRRDLNPNQETVLPEDVFEDFNFDPGCRAYVRSGFIKVITEDENIKELVEVAPKDVDLDVRDLLSNQSASELGKVLKNASDAVKEKIVEQAIKLSISDPARCALIKAHCNVDILNAIQFQRSIGN